MKMRRIRGVSDWAARVIEHGPKGAGGMARDVLDEASRMILFRRGSNHSNLMDELAEDCLELCLGHFIKAPPGIHSRLMLLEEYRSRVRFMRSL
jgi:hypothetical protein